MITVKCIYSNGDTITTSFNGTVDDANQYFLNQYFNIGTVVDNMQQCVKIESMSK
ncbi:hypothetical protein Cpap_1504 [Ruminiclostridium papyrosolvens DSM 2782]|uniref:Uncharacterized protein n=1 Tax=Ruminiclostridium papyrosolvens DSM 2782 TaxID=588581 RepID=F1TEE6_9FIRM|nr:hypothetical protein [Ruminiclostridium papyrosolvens]EGD47112.1 hypothetical protein Cpap_1504 [Ruminiclostridium papyrosolvens DSM 2782]WES36055.1 hypothetical protein P0092_08855 [Ruminiclostridium papyrosolvens DSM 2782]WES36153.1 hypothetical protein P0092_09355 [Ruminiclostridium papyrosolvens DSM 2782]